MPTSMISAELFHLQRNAQFEENGRSRLALKTQHKLHIFNWISHGSPSRPVVMGWCCWTGCWTGALSLLPLGLLTVVSWWWFWNCEIMWGGCLFLPGSSSLPTRPETNTKSTSFHSFIRRASARSSTVVLQREIGFLNRRNTISHSVTIRFVLD